MRQECSFRQWISVYFDGEMVSPWKEKMEAHIKGCADCAGQLEAYKKISLSLALKTRTFTFPSFMPSARPISL